MMMHSAIFSLTTQQIHRPLMPPSTAPLSLGCAHTHGMFYVTAAMFAVGNLLLVYSWCAGNKVLASTNQITAYTIVYYYADISLCSSYKPKEINKKEKKNTTVQLKQPPPPHGNTLVWYQFLHISSHPTCGTMELIFFFHLFHHDGKQTDKQKKM